MHLGHMAVIELISVGGETLSLHWLALGHMTSASSCDDLGDSGAAKTTKAAKLSRSQQGGLPKGERRGFVIR